MPVLQRWSRVEKEQSELDSLEGVESPLHRLGCLPYYKSFGKLDGWRISKSL